MRIPYYLLLRVVRRIVEIPRRGWPTLRPNATGFDREWGTETEKIVWLTNPMSRNFVHGVRYEACSPRACRWAIESAGIAYPDFHFVDLGAGKGRPLLIASQFPFRRLVGVEYSAKLCAQARANLARASVSARRFDMVCVDAAEYDFEPRHTFVYMHNPFGPEVLGRILEKLRALAETHRVIVAYEGPRVECLANEPWLHTLETGPNIVLFTAAPPPDLEALDPNIDASRLNC